VKGESDAAIDMTIGVALWMATESTVRMFISEHPSLLVDDALKFAVPLTVYKKIEW